MKTIIISIVMGLWALIFIHFMLHLIRRVRDRSAGLLSASIESIFVAACAVTVMIAAFAGVQWGLSVSLIWLLFTICIVLRLANTMALRSTDAKGRRTGWMMRSLLLGPPALIIVAATLTSVKISRLAPWDAVAVTWQDPIVEALSARLDMVAQLAVEADALKESSDYDVAVKFFDEIDTQLAHASSQIRILRADAKFAAGDYEAAQNDYHAAAAHYPDMFRVTICRYLCLLHLKKEADADACLDAYLAGVSQTENAELIALLRSTRSSGSFARLDVRDNPSRDTAYAYRILAEQEWACGRREQAKAYYNLSVETSGRKYSSWNLLSRMNGERDADGARVQK